jgi:uncharacterized protein (TIGR02265 family)
MSDAPVMFSSAIEGLIRALGDRLDVTTNAPFKAAGIDLLGKIQPAYDRAIWLQASRLAGELLFPGKPVEEQQHLLGHRFMNGFAETLVGKALATMMRMVGPRKTLDRIQRNFRMGNNFTEATLREVELHVCELWISPVAYPEFYQGLVEAGLMLAGGKSVEAMPVKREGESVTLRVRWS